MQYALVSSTCKTTRRNMTLAVERDLKQQRNKYKLKLSIQTHKVRGRWYVTSRINTWAPVNAVQTTHTDEVVSRHHSWQAKTPGRTDGP